MWLTANRVGTFQEYDVLRKASQRVDLLAMAWQQTVMKRNCVLQYLYLDSSPQGGFNYFVGKAREFVFPKVFEQLRFGGAPMRLWTQRMNLSLQEHFVGTRTIPVTVLQHGQAGLVYKLHNVLHAIGLECGSAANFESWRWGVMCIASDQSTESKLVDCPKVASWDFHDVQAAVQAVPVDGEALDQSFYCFPRGMWMPDLCHITYDALKGALTTAADWPPIERAMRAISNFLCDRPLRMRFVKVCVRDNRDAALFQKFSETHINFEFEFLTRFLDQVVPLLRPLLKHWNLAKLKGATDGDDLGESSKKQLAVDETLKMPGIEAIFQGLHHVGKLADFGVHWSEGCRCHEPILAHSRYQQSKRKMDELVGIVGCPWKNARGPEMVTSFRDLWQRKLISDENDKYDKELRWLAMPLRTKIIHLISSIRHRFAEEIKHKLQFWDHIPYKIAGIFICEVDSEMQAVSVRIANECVEEFDSMVETGVRKPTEPQPIEFDCSTTVNKCTDRNAQRCKHSQALNLL